MNGSDILVVLGTNPVDTREPEVPGYRCVGVAMQGAVRLHESEGPAPRVDRFTHGPALTWVSGTTSSGSPARDLEAWCEHQNEQGSPGEPPLVGHFLAARMLPDALTIWTDHLGLVPLFHAEHADGRQFVGTDLLVVARMAGRTSLDPVSAREFVGRGAVTAPYTLFLGARRLPPGSRIRITRGGPGPRISHAHYWLPTPEGAPPDLGTAALQLRDSVTAFVDSVMARSQAPLVLLSGGEDSRVLAALAMRHRPRGSVRGAIFVSRPNRELHLAQVAAGILGVVLEPRWRPADQYTTDVWNRIQLVGPGVDLRHAHALGLITPDESDLVLVGQGADFLFKAMLLPTRRAEPGRPWSALELDDSADWRPAITREAPTVLEGVLLDEEVAQRRRDHVDVVRSFRSGRDAEVWSRYWPYTDGYAHGFTLSVLAAAPAAAPYMIGPALDAIRGLPETAKLNRDLFRSAFGRQMGVSGLIPRSGGEIPSLAGPVGRAASAVVATQFTRADSRLSPGATGPWMSDRIVADQSLALLDQADPVVVEHCLGFLAGTNPSQQVLSHPHPPTRLLQLVVLAEHLGVPPPPPDAVPGANPLTNPGFIRNSRGALIHVDQSDPRGRHLIWTAGDYNPISLRMWQRIIEVRSWDLVVDVGANYGEMLVGCDLPADATVVAYEPSPAVLPFLRRTLSDHRPGVEVRPVAVGAQPGRATLLVNRRWSGTTRLGDPSEEPEFEPVEVEVVTLDGDLTGTSARTACVKIDVEGGEVDVVNGGMEFLRGLEDFACLIEILHLPSDALAELSRRFDFYLWDLRLERFSRVAPCDPASFEARLASGAYYRQDAVLRPRDDPSMKARAQASAQDIGDLMASLTRREAELLRTDQVRVSKAELERLRRDRAQLGEVLSSRSFRWMAGPRRGASAVRSLTRRFR